MHWNHEQSTAQLIKQCVHLVVLSHSLSCFNLLALLRYVWCWCTPQYNTHNSRKTRDRSIHLVYHHSQASIHLDCSKWYSNIDQAHNHSHSMTWWNRCHSLKPMQLLLMGLWDVTDFSISLLSSLAQCHQRVHGEWHSRVLCHIECARAEQWTITIRHRVYHKRYQD